MQEQPANVGRRKLVAGGTAVAATSWIAPSILKLDSVAASVGSCGAAALQVDWTSVAGTFPNLVTANDGTLVGIATLDPFGVADPSFLGLAFNGTTSTLDNPIIMAMSNATGGQYTEIVFTFSNPVAVCFTMLDIDFGAGGWEDTIIFEGTNGVTAVDLGPGDIVTSPGNTITGPNAVLGTSNIGNGSTDANIDVTYPAPITQLRIRHSDETALTAFQYVGIHDFYWC